MTKILVTTAVTISLLCGAFAHAQTNWTTFGFDRQRTGYNPEEAILSPQTVPSVTPQWSIDLGAPMTAQPIEMYGILYAATWGGMVYALNPASGSVLWAVQLATVSSDCGDFAPSGGVIGVLHTLSSDWGNGRIYAISGDGLLHALDAVTGLEWPGYPIQVMDPSVGEVVWGSPSYSWENGSLYVPVASGCEEGSYRGRIVQVDVISSHTPQVINRWFVNGSDGPFGGGIWGYGGVSLDPTVAVYAATGNAIADPESYGYSDKAVVRLDLNLNVQAADGPYIPDGDFDFGSTPALYQAPGCPLQLASLNKNGQLFIYNRDAIGNGPMQVLQISGSGGYVGYLGSVAYDPVFNQIYTSNNVDDGVGVFHHGLIALAPQSDCTLALAWQQTVGLSECCDVNPNIPPIAANGVVYHSTSAGGQIYAFDAASGRYLWDSGSVSQNGIYASPMVVNGQLFVAAFNHKLYAFGLP